MKMLKKNIIKLCILYFILLFIFLLLYNNTQNIMSKVKCIGSDYNRSCIYTNMFYVKGKWFVKGMNKKKIKCVAIRSRSSNKCFKPISTQYNIQYNRIINGLSTYISLFGMTNIGHLLFDNLYPIYLSFLKFNYTMNSFNIILSKSNSKWRYNWITKIFEKFSMNRIIYECDMIEKIYFVKYLIVGLGHQCQRCINKDYSIAGGQEYKATWWMRNRMYYTYNISQCVNKYAIIVDNKRYSLVEMNILKHIITNYTNRLKIEYIDWRKYPDFNDQLQILSCTSIYISGPGTGLLYFPFISDPGVIINLGGLYRGCPSFMEQYIEEGSQHFISLYYPSNRRKYGLKENEIKMLIEKAITILDNWQIHKAQHKSNLNIEGKIFKKLYNINPYLMKKLLIDTDWAKEGGHGIWAERLIYFPYCYNLYYIVGVIVNVTISYKNELGCEISKSKELCD